jgi:O-antigen ligase
MKFSGKILLITILSVIFGEIFRLNLGGGIILKPLDIGVGISVAWWLLLKLISKERIIPQNIFIPILLFAGTGLLSLLVNYSSLSIYQFLASLMYLMRWVAYAGIFFVVGDFDKNLKGMTAKMLLIIGSIIVALGYVQYFFYPDLHNLFYLGWDEHMFRMFSVFLDPNFAGAFFVLFFLYLVSIFIKNKSILIGLLSILTLGGIFLTFSRSALIMLIVSSSLLFILMNKKRMIFLLLVITLIMLTISSRYFNIENINLFRGVSSGARLETAKNALLVFEKSPIIGVGFNSYKYFQLRYGLRFDNSMSHADAGSDSSILFVLATTGIIGLVIYLFLWLRLLKDVSALAVASIVGIFTDSMFINSLFYPFIMFWLWIILALSIKDHNRIAGSK